MHPSIYEKDLEAYYKNTLFFLMHEKNVRVNFARKVMTYSGSNEKKNFKWGWRRWSRNKKSVENMYIGGMNDF